MKELSLIVGIIAVAVLLIGFLQKERKKIVLLNAISRVLFVVQYLLLSAFEGAVLDVAGAISAFVANKKDAVFVSAHKKTVVISINLLIVLMGLLLYEDIFSLLPILGVLIHTGALWLDSEKRIRQVTLIGSPFWLLYNFIKGAYGSCMGDILSMVFVVTAMIRYDLKKTNKEGQK